MPNLYGVANAPGLPIYFQNSTGDTLCTAGVYTACFTSTPLVAPSQGYFYAIAWFMLEITAGASIATGYQTALAIGAGSYANPVGYSTTGVAPNQTIYMPYTLWTTPSQAAWQGAGSTVTVGFLPGGQNATVKQYSQGTICLFRAPDQ